MSEKRLLKEVVGDNDKPQVEDVKVKVDVKVSIQGQDEEEGLDSKKESKTSAKKVLMG